MHVLIVDDEPVARLMTSTAVKRLGHECSVASDGEEAWKELQARSDVSVLITDWEMPGMDGASLVSLIRGDVRRPYIYIMVLTGRADRAAALATMHAGADDLVVKPLDLADLERKLVAAERVTAMHHHMHQEARHDALTRLGNRLRLSEDMVALRGRAERYGHVYSVALFDIDHFKAYNDIRGHLEGDVALRAVAGVLADKARSGDSLYRYGGEEFVMLLPEQTVDGAALAAERLRAAVQELELAHPAGGVVTVSAGVASLNEDVASPEEIFEAADRALYRAKEAGRNRVEPRPMLLTGALAQGG